MIKTSVIKRSIVVGGHKTSVSLEDPFWKSLKEIARVRRDTLSDLIGDIDNQRSESNLSSAIRMFVLDHYRTQTPTFAADQLAIGVAASTQSPSPSVLNGR